jgi:hypothetical protein
MNLFFIVLGIFFHITESIKLMVEMVAVGYFFLRWMRVSIQNFICILQAQPIVRPWQIDKHALSREPVETRITYERSNGWVARRSTILTGHESVVEVAAMTLGIQTILTLMDSIVRLKTVQIMMNTTLFLHTRLLMILLIELTLAAAHVMWW